MILLFPLYDGSVFSPGLEVKLNLLMLNSTEHGIYHAHNLIVNDCWNSNIY